MAEDGFEPSPFGSAMPTLYPTELLCELIVSTNLNNQKAYINLARYNIIIRYLRLALLGIPNPTLLEY